MGFNEVFVVDLSGNLMKLKKLNAKIGYNDNIIVSRQDYIQA